MLMMQIQTGNTFFGDKNQRVFHVFFTCFLDAVLYIVENFLKNSGKTMNFQKHHFGGLSPPGTFFRYIFSF